MKTCWARALGGCSDKLSREHIVSASLWDGDTITVKGFPWCRSAPQRVGANALTSKILCKSHNSDLSPLDEEAGRAFKVLQRATQLANQRATSRPRRKDVVRLEVERPWLLERWFLKTAINVVAVHPGAVRWRSTGAPANEPPEQLVRIAYGLEPFRAPMGLYNLASPGELIPFSDIFHLAPLLYGADEMIGFLAVFRGLRFILHVEESPLPQKGSFDVAYDRRWSEESRLLYRLPKLTWGAGKQLSHYVHFRWHLAPRS